MTPYDLAYEYAMHTNECIYLTGKAGTGKTTFLRRLQRECPKQIMVCAPTGVAAINAEGVTIHSLFQLPPQVFMPTDRARDTLFREMRLTDKKLRILRNLELLVIDEVSMVRSDLLDTIDAVLRHVRRRSSLPFGGVQLLLIGDLYQLSPVAREEEWTLMRPYYQGPYFFQARVFQAIHPVYIELDKVYRQTNQDFVHLLNEVRTNTLSAEGLRMLNSRYQPGYRDKESILLSTHNHKVDAINERELADIHEPVFRYMAKIEKTFPESMYPMETELVLKKGARVMFIKNDSTADKAYYNGKLGTVVDLSDEAIMVACPGEDKPIKVHRETWENLRYVTDDNRSDEIGTEVIGTFSHYPLRLAWAVTIHKAQGLTFDRVIIDAEDAFASGQVYVALSRCRSLEGITLLSPIPSAALTNAREVLQFSQYQPSVEEIESRLNPSELSYLLVMLCSLYDFRDSHHQLERLLRIVRNGSFNQPVTDDFLRALDQPLMDWQRVAESFQNQIRTIFAAPVPDFAYLSQRLKDAFAYFGPRIEPVIQRLLQSPALTDDKSDAADYQQCIEELYHDLSRQHYIMKGIGEKTSIKRFFDLRRSFSQPQVKISARLEEKKLTEADCQHPKLMESLRKLRARLCKEMGVPAYVLAPTSALVAICNELPTNKQQLMRIKGFGPKMYGIWGEQLLEQVRRYNDHRPAKSFIRSLETLKYILKGKTIDETTALRAVPREEVVSDCIYLLSEGVITPDKFSADDLSLINNQ